MIDFSSLERAGSSDEELNPLEIFRSLPKPEEVNDLWESQADALRGWHDRRIERDLVIKLNTGGGKTLVGLLIGESLRRERALPVLYLAPTRQLADQALAKAQELGIAAVPYPDARLGHEFRNAEAIMICTYHALFNGRSRFGILGRGEPVELGACILDDAHTSAGILRDLFSLSIKRETHEDLYNDLVVRFRGSFEKIDAAGTLDDMIAGRESALLEVPYWAWIDAADSVREDVQALADDHFVFSFPLIRDHFRYCHALVADDAFTITPLQPLVHMIPSFAECERRVFMSATIADDGVLVRTFGGSAETLQQPITTRSVAGLGERMILAPTLSGIPEDVALELARDLSAEVRQQDKGAVVIVPSAREANDRWLHHGEISIGDDVIQAVEELNTPILRGSSLRILVNRYDGIDLPQDSCRLLVLDGKPRGATAYELYRANRLEGMNSINISLAQRVEQGMGRGTRGSGDYCVVILLGRDLVEWLGRRDTQRVLTPGTRAQVELGREIAGQVADRGDMWDAAVQCLNRDPQWKRLHAQRIAEAGEQEADTAEMVEAGRIERKAFDQVLYGQAQEARDTLQAAADAYRGDARFRGWLLQLAARAAFHAGAVETAGKLQAQAYASHRVLLKPRSNIQYQRIAVITGQADTVVAIVEEYAIRSAVLEAIDDALADLKAEASANRFEEAVRRLGRFLGWHSERPESAARSGPDNLWLAAGNIGFVIECKHQKLTPLNKKDHGQLRVALEWFSRTYGEYSAVPVSIHPDGTATTEAEVADSNVRALTFAKLRGLKTAVKVVYRELAFSGGEPATLRAKAAALLEENGLTPELFADRFLTPFTIFDE